MMGWKIVGGIMSTIFVVLSLSLLAISWSGRHGRSEAASVSLVITTPSGSYQGVADTFDGKNYVGYRSIPFAKPPVGPLRFQPPQPLDTTPPSLQVVNSDAYKQSCWSSTKTGTEANYGEDCLYLNVFVPGDSAAPPQLLPVMVWIHSGGFVAGSTFPEPGKLVTRGDVIVVTVNYRLGVFGFLTTEDDVLPGNNGLWDQYMALKWVKENIHYFNGNESSITVFGESAGGISTSLLALSPIASHLFQKAIVQSGAATSLRTRDHRQRAMEFAALVGCPQTSSTLLATCLRQKSVQDLLSNDKPSMLNMSSAQAQLDFVWCPVVDGALIPDEPLLLLQNVTYLEQVGIFEKDFLVGVLNNEGSLMSLNFLNTIPLSRLSNKRFFEEMTDFLVYSRYGSSFNYSRDLQRAIYTFYTGSPQLLLPPPPQNLLDMGSDAAFVVPTVEFAQAISQCHRFRIPSCQYAAISQSTTQSNSNPSLPCRMTDSKLFLYHVDHCPPSDPCLPSCSLHGSDVAWEFPRSPITDPVEKQLSDTYIDLLSTFAKTSDPGTVISSGWPTYDPINQFYLQIGLNPNVRSFLYDQRVNFWLKTVPDLITFNS